jgi:hypothetical protein
MPEIFAIPVAKTGMQISFIIMSFLNVAFSSAENFLIIVAAYMMDN